jgi:hypothetical protein
VKAIKPVTYKLKIKTGVEFSRGSRSLVAGTVPGNLHCISKAASGHKIFLHVKTPRYYNNLLGVYVFFFFFSTTVL